MKQVTEGIVLREVNYKEADKILTVLTRERGKITVSARNSRKKGGGISAAAQLLVWSEMTLSEFRGRWTLTDAATELEFRNLRNNLDKLALASYFAELTEVMVPEGQSAPETLALLLNTLYALDSFDRPLALVKAAFELRMLSISGYAPALEGCALCGREPEHPRFHLREGLLHCRECKMGGGISMPLSAGTLAAMRYITTCQGKKIFSFRMDEAGLRQLEGVSEAFLLTQLERGFHTLDFYKQITGAFRSEAR